MLIFVGISILITGCIIILYKQTDKVFLILVFVPLLSLPFIVEDNKTFSIKEKIIVQEGFFDTEYIFKKDIDGGYSALIKKDEAYQKVSVKKDGIYNPDKNLYFVIYEGKNKKTDWKRIRFQDIVYKYKFVRE